jgi:hypothetical protein
MHTQLHEQLSLSDAEVILLRLPERIRTALIDHAAEIEYPIKDLIFTLIQQASELKAVLKPRTAATVGDVLLLQQLN